MVPGGEAGLDEQLDQPLPDGRRVLARLEDAVLPSSRLGPSIHSGTANGKFHGVMTATTPHGLRRMKASFSAISEAITSPIRHAAGAEDVLHHVQPFDHLGPALGHVLAALAGHELGEGVGVALDELGEPVEALRAQNPRLCAATRGRRPRAASTAAFTSPAWPAGSVPTTSARLAGLRAGEVVARRRPFAGDGEPTPDRGKKRAMRHLQTEVRLPHSTPRRRPLNSPPTAVRNAPQKSLAQDSQDGQDPKPVSWVSDPVHPVDPVTFFCNSCHSPGSYNDVDSPHREDSRVCPIRLSCSSARNRGR